MTKKNPSKDVQINIRILKDDYELLKSSRVPYYTILKDGMSFHFLEENSLITEKNNLEKTASKLKSQRIQEELDIKTHEYRIEKLNKELLKIDRRIMEIDDELSDRQEIRFQEHMDTPKEEVETSDNLAYTSRLHSAVKTARKNRDVAGCSPQRYIVAYEREIRNICKAYEVGMADVIMILEKD